MSTGLSGLPDLDKVREVTLPCYHDFAREFRALLNGCALQGMSFEVLPRGSEYPNSKVLGPKIHTLNGFWTLKPYYLGTWTLRVRTYSGAS